VSVIIPTRDRPNLLDEALASVAAQDVAGDIEAIVVDVGELSAASVVKSWSNTLPITFVEFDRHSRPSAARNAGIGRSLGEFIAFLDDDDLFLPDHLAAGLKPLQSNEADFVYLGAIVADQRLNGVSPNPSEFPLKAYPYDHRFLLVANFIHTGSVIVRNFRNTLVRFDEALDVCEDWDMWLALTTTLHYRVAFIDKITSVYHQVAGRPGLVASAQLVAPSRFSVARDYIQEKWASDDSLVHQYRDWMNSLERFRSNLIAKEQRMPNLLFDAILMHLNKRMSSGQPPQYAEIERFFGSANL
jgi:glycosyltransferase involved in cell wall biosynthesis